MEISIFNSWSLVGLAVDALIVAWMLASLERGFKKGFVYSLVGLTTLAIAVVGAWILSGLLADPVAQLIRGGDTGSLVTAIPYGTTKQVVRVALAIVFALIITLLVKPLGKGLSRVLNDVPLIGGLNRLLGALLSAAVTAALILAILYAWESFFRESYDKVLAGTQITRFVSKHNIIAELFGRLK